MIDYLLGLLRIALRACFAMIGAGVALIVTGFLYRVAFDGEAPSPQFYIGTAALFFFAVVSDALEIVAKKK